MRKEREMYVHVKTDSHGSECSESMGIAESDWNELSEKEQQEYIDDFIGNSRGLSYEARNNEMGIMHYQI